MISSRETALSSLIIRGPYQGVSGHDHHVREFTRQLAKNNIAVELQNFKRWAPTDCINKNENEFNTYNKKVDANTILHFVMPHQVEVVSNKRNINFTMFEADRIPKHWLEHNLKHDSIILPTESSKQAWVNSGYPEERIQLCPLGINASLFQQKAMPISLTDNHGKLISEYKTRILNISDLIPRKNLIGMLRVWIKNTSYNDDAILIIKTSTPWKRWLYKFLLDVRKMEWQIGKSRKQAAPILLLLNQKYSDEEMQQLYSTVTHYWSMSFGEGWDLCMMEAGAAGLHLIAPNHSSYPTYLNTHTADMISSRSVPAKFFWAYGMHKLFKDSNWWEPDENSAGEFIQQVARYGNNKKRNAAKASILENYSWEKAATRLIECLE